MSNALAIGGLNPYPSLEEAANLVRTITNDDGGTPIGSGQIIVDSQTISVKLINSLNEAIREVYRELRTVGAPVLIADNYIVTNLPVINGINGEGAPDPSTQVVLTYTGFFDGTEMWPNLTLPINMLMPLKVEARQTGTNLPFVEVPQAQDGLPSGYQGWTLGSWEWRGDKIWFNGSLYSYDVKIRYQLKLPLFYGQNIDFTQTYIPIQDCVSAVAYKAAYIIAFSLGSQQAADLKTRADQEMFHLRNENVRRAQGMKYHRPAYQEGHGNHGGFIY